MSDEPRPTLLARLRAWLSGLTPVLEGFDARVTVVMLTGSLLLLVFKKYGGSGTFEASIAPREWAADPRLSLFSDGYWFLTSFLLLGVIPYAILRMLGVSTRDAGLGLGDWRFGLKWVGLLLAVMLPVVAVASRGPGFFEYYPLNDLLRSKTAEYLRDGKPEGLGGWFLLYQLLYALYFVGWEYFFRGFLAFGLHERLRFNAVLAANIPFVIMHAGKPFPEALGSIFAGLALGVFALRARSFWYCWLLHALVALSMDLLAVERRWELLPS